jgi:hypothetical protein
MWAASVVSSCAVETAVTAPDGSVEKVLYRRQPLASARVSGLAREVEVLVSLASRPHPHLWSTFNYSISDAEVMVCTRVAPAATSLHNFGACWG